MTRVYLIPLTCAILTMAGLLLALVSDDGVEAIGVIAVIVPLLLLSWKLR